MIDESKNKLEDNNNFSEGAGKLMASIGKEIDEHDTVGKIGNATADSIKSNAFVKKVIGFAIIFVFIIPAIISVAAALIAIFANVFARI